MARVVAIANQKGGVGKTTTAINLAASVAVMENKTLLIDLDPQGNTTSGLGFDKNSGRQMYQVMSGSCELASVIRHTDVPFLSIVTAGPDLAGAEIELVGEMARESRLKDLLATVSARYDYIFIDCPPALGLITLNALVASDSVLIPVQSEYYALEGLSELIGTIGRVRDRLNPNLQIEGILMTLVDIRTRLAREVISEVSTHFGADVFDTWIPRNIKLSEAPSHGKPILLYDIASSGAQSYLRLARELLETRGGDRT